MLCVLIYQNVATSITFLSIVAPLGVKWMNHINLTGSCIALAFLFMKLATKRDLLVNPISAGTWKVKLWGSCEAGEIVRRSV